MKAIIATSIVLLTIQQVSRAQDAVTVGMRPIMLHDTGAGEGPAWHPALGLLTSFDGAIMRRSIEGKQSTFMDDSGSNGLLFDREGRLVICQAKYRRIARLDKSGKVTVLVDNYQGSKFNQPNDLTIDNANRIYFTDPQYGSRDQMEMKDERGRFVEGVYRIDPDGTVTRVITHEVDRPNGIVITPDNQSIYIADNNNNTLGGARKLWKFKLFPNGDIDHTSRQLIYDWKTSRGPDGMKLDAKGRLYVAGGLTRQNPPFEVQKESTAGIYVFSSAEKLLKMIPIPRDEVTNCAFGGEDLQTLFVTAGGTLWSVRTTAPGIPVWPTRP